MPLAGSPGLALSLLTPDFLLAAMYHSQVARSINLRIAGNFIGVYAPRSSGGAEFDPTDGGRRSISQLDLLVQGTSEHIRIVATGELAPNEEQSKTSLFSFEVCVQLTALESVISDIAAKRMATALVRTLSRGSGW